MKSGVGFRGVKGIRVSIVGVRDRAMLGEEEFRGVGFGSRSRFE